MKTGCHKLQSDCLRLTVRSHAVAAARTDKDQRPFVDADLRRFFQKIEIQLRRLFIGFCFNIHYLIDHSFPLLFLCDCLRQLDLSVKNGGRRSGHIDQVLFSVPEDLQISSQKFHSHFVLRKSI